MNMNLRYTIVEVKSDIKRKYSSKIQVLYIKFEIKYSTSVNVLNYCPVLIIYTTAFLNVTCQHVSCETGLL